jgi:ATP-dependent Clp protease protease subunit
MDGETWMNANKAKELGFCDEIMFLPGPAPDNAPENSFSFSRRAVTNSLLDKLKTQIPRPSTPDTRVKAADLEKRLSLLK